MMSSARAVAWLPFLAAAWWPLPAAGGVQLPVPTELPSPSQPPPARIACGDYEGVPTGVVGSRATRLLLQRDGRVITTITDWAVSAVSCDDLTGDGEPELLARTFTGGAHCCETVRVWTLGRKPRLILDYAAGNAGGAVVRDLNDDGRAELLLGDDGLAYFGDLDFANSPSSVPLVACFAEESFRDCTVEHPGLLREAAARFRERLVRPSAGGSRDAIRGAALGLLAVSLLLGEDEKARQEARGLGQGEQLAAWLERVMPRLRVWAEGRGRKLKRSGS